VAATAPIPRGIATDEAHSELPGVRESHGDAGSVLDHVILVKMYSFGFTVTRAPRTRGSGVAECTSTSEASAREAGFMANRAAFYSSAPGCARGYSTT
jgi:hypothetical protein